MKEPQAISVQIAKLELAPGDVLVAKVAGRVSQEMAAYFKEQVEPLLHGGKLLVIDSSVELAVLTRAEIESRKAA